MVFGKKGRKWLWKTCLEDVEIEWYVRIIYKWINAAEVGSGVDLFNNNSEQFEVKKPK